MSAIDDIPNIITQIYGLVGKLEARFPNRKFTPDGHLVGSIGEVIAASRYGLELLPASSKTHDAKAINGSLVQIKATQVNSVSLRSEPEFLIVLKILPDGTTQEIYNGPGKLVWDRNRCGKIQKNGQRSISIKNLSMIQQSVPADQRLKEM